MRHAFKIAAAVGAASLLFAGCSKPADSSSASDGASSPSSSTAAASGSLKACMVLDVGGVDDHSFNQSSWGGLQAANKANPNIKISYVPSSSQNDYTPNLTAETNKGCDTVIAVGGLMTDAVTKIAKKNPDQQYAQIDSASSGPNVYGLQYNTAQGGFLGGYLAAGMSKTGTVATYGGLNIPPVTIYMDGFWEGVQYYNKQNKQERQGPRLGRGATRRAARSPTRSPTPTRASRSPSSSSSRVPTSCSRSPVAPASARPLRRPRPAVSSP